MDMKKLEGIVFAQGWMDSQIKSLTPDNTVVIEWQEKWKTIDAALDELIRENQDMSVKLNAVKEIINQ